MIERNYVIAINACEIRRGVQFFFYFSFLSFLSDFLLQYQEVKFVDFIINYHFGKGPKESQN